MKVSIDGYKKNSKDKNEKSLVIPSGNITMKGVPFDVVGVDNLGNVMVMKPGSNYAFPGTSVTEYPMKQMGGVPTFNVPLQRQYTEKEKTAAWDAWRARKKDSFDEDLFELLDPTGISSWDDVKDSFNDPKASTAEVLWNLMGAIPVAGKLSRIPKALETVNRAAQFATDQSQLFKKKGGEVSAQKAKEILHDGTVHGHALTDRQRRFFGAMSNKKDGGEMKKTPTNKGFKSLPKKVQEKIIAHMDQGGALTMPYPAYLAMGGVPFMDTSFLPFYMQMGGGTKVIDPAHYASAFTNFEKMGAGDRGIWNAGTTTSPQQFKELGFSAMKGVKDAQGNPVYTKGDLAVIKHPGGMGWVDVGNPNQLKFKGMGPAPGQQTGVLPQTQPQVQPQANINPVTNQQPRQPINFNTPGYNYNPNTGQFQGQNTGQQITPIVQQYQMGGQFTKKEMSNLIGDILKRQYGGGAGNDVGKMNRGQSAQQGDTTQSLIQKNKDVFADYLKGNMMLHMITEELGNAGFIKDHECTECQHNKQFGGSYTSMNRGGLPGAGMYGSYIPFNYAQMGGAYYMQPGGSVPPYGGGNWGDFTGGQFGAYSNQNQGVPNYVSGMQQQTAFPTIQSNNSYGTESRPVSNSGDYRQPPQKKQFDWQKASQVADITMAGMNAFSNAAEAYRNKQYQNKLRDQMSANNVFKSTYGSRGDYDMNSGMFKPNQQTPIQYKKGGQYRGSDAEIARLRSMGYEIEIVD